MPSLKKNSLVNVHHFCRREPVEERGGGDRIRPHILGIYQIPDLQLGEFCGEGDKWFEIFPMNVRKAAAAQWADSFKVEADLGNYDTPTFK